MNIQTKWNPFHNVTPGTGPFLVQEMDYEQLFSNVEANNLKSEQQYLSDLNWDCGPIVKHPTDTSQIKKSISALESI